MKEKQFKVGDRIKLNPLSRYYNQAKDEIGTITGMDYITEDDGIGYHSSWIKVEFDNDYKNSYLPEDLCYPVDHAKLTSNKEITFRVGDRIQITQGTSIWNEEMDQYIGKIATITSEEEGFGGICYRIDIDKGEWHWFSRHGHFIHARQAGIDQKDELLYRAKQMFPVGSKVRPAHISPGSEGYITIIDTDFTFDENGDIVQLLPNGDLWYRSDVRNPQYGNCEWNRVLYDKSGKWATIIDDVVDDKPIPQHKFNLGDWVIANSKADERYAVTTEGWSGQVTKVRDDGYISVKGKYNEDNDEYNDLDPDRFDLTTESKLMELTVNVEAPIVHKYKVGDILHLIESFVCVEPQKVTVQALSTRHGRPAYRLNGWSGDFPEDILVQREAVKPTNKFKEGDWVIGTCAPYAPYAITCKGWIGKVVGLNADGTMDVNADSSVSIYRNLQPEYFEHYKTESVFSSDCLQQQMDKVLAKIVEIPQAYLDSLPEYKPKLPVSKVKKVSFTRI